MTASTIGTVVSASNDRRTGGKVFDDKTIAFKLFNWSGNDKLSKEAHLNFMVYDRTVLVTGEAPSKRSAQYIVQQAQLQDHKIQQVVNELSIGPNSSIINRIKDTGITTQIEAMFLNQEVFHPTHVKVMTENQIVYLMGAVTQREADKAVNIASKAKWVRKVVKLFNYLKTRPAAEIERDRQRELAKQKELAIKQKQAELDVQKAKLKQELRALGGNVEGTPY